MHARKQTRGRYHILLVGMDSLSVIVKTPEKMFFNKGSLPMFPRRIGGRRAGHTRQVSAGQKSQGDPLSSSV